MGGFPIGPGAGLSRWKVHSALLYRAPLGPGFSQSIEPSRDLPWGAPTLVSYVKYFNRRSV